VIQLNPYLLILYKIAFFWVIAVISPGPNFLVSLNTAIQHGKTQSLRVVLGIVSGTALWAITGFLGINFLFTIAPWLYRILKITGAIYLIYLGLSSIFFKKKQDQNQEIILGEKRNLYYFQKGLLVNLSNPKTAVFISSLFATTIPPDLGWSLSFFTLLILITISFCWYSLVCVFFSSKRIGPLLRQKKSIIDKLSGSVFILWGMKLLYYDTVST
jgi:threonine/homoserine/homoserine lactone efflux protein